MPAQELGPACLAVACFFSWVPVPASFYGSTLHLNPPGFLWSAFLPACDPGGHFHCLIISPFSRFLPGSDYLGGSPLDG